MEILVSPYLLIVGDGFRHVLCHGIPQLQTACEHKAPGGHTYAIQLREGRGHIVIPFRRDVLYFTDPKTTAALREVSADSFVLTGKLIQQPWSRAS